MTDEERSDSDEQDGGRRARLFRTRGIVLRRMDLGEADRIVTILTAEHGKRRIVAKGSRRPSSKLAGHLEPFTATRLLVARTRGLAIISQAETIEPFATLRMNEGAIAMAGYFAELVDTFMPDEEVHEGVHALLFATLRLLDEGREPRPVARVFEMGLLRQLGYRPELYACVSCGSLLQPETNGFILDGGVICSSCRRLRPDASDLSVNALKLLRLIDRGEIERVLGLRASDALWSELGDALGRYLVRVSGRESSARRVMDALGLE